MNLVITKEQAEKIAQLIQPIPSNVGIAIMDVLRALQPLDETAKAEIKDEKVAPK